ATTMGRIIELPRAFDDDARLAPWQHVLAACLVLAAVGTLVLHLTMTAREQQQRKPVSSMAVQAAFVVALVTAFLCSFLVTPQHRQDGHLFFFFLRAMDTGIGLTPTIPLFIVGISVYVAALMQLSVLRRAAVLRRDADERDPAHVASAKHGQETRS